MRYFLAGLVLTLVALTVTPASAEVLVADDFDDNSLDTGKWSTDVSGYAGANVEETNQEIKLTGRGYLNTAQQFDPADYAHGIQITGQWTFGSSSDFFQVLTRSSGEPDPGYWGETTSGIEFNVPIYDTSALTIRGRGGAGISGLAKDTSHLTLATGTVYDFKIYDNGSDLLFYLAENGNSSNYASATATSTFASTTDYIVFHNREGTGNISYLDNVLIEAIPEPGTWAMLLGLAGAGLVSCLRLRRRRS